MTEQGRTIMATTVGAILGAFVGYAFFTERGRALRRQLEPALEDAAQELAHFRGTLAKAASVAREGWKLLNDTLGEDEAQASRFRAPRQTSPF